MKNILVQKRTFSLVLTSFLLLAGCETLMTREGVRDVEQKREINDRVTTLQKTTADVNSRFSDLEADQRQMGGRIEVVENRMGQASLDREKQKRVSDEQMQDLQKKVQVLQDEVSKMQDIQSALKEEIVNLKVKAAEVPAVAAAPSKEAATGFDLAEELFNQKDYKKAILNYQKFRDSKPKDKRVSEATYKIGVSFQELGLKDEAKSFYQELISKFPNTNEAKKAKIRLKKLK